MPAKLHQQPRLHHYLNTNTWNRLRYTLYAPVYDWTAPFARARRRSLALLDLQPGQRVLIPGAGTGLDLPWLPAGVEVTAVDLASAMLARLRERADRLGLPVDARVMDAHQLAFPDAAFDAAVLHLIVAVIPQPVRLLHEVGRVLREGGRAVVFDKLVRPGQRPSAVRRALNVVTNAVFSDITRSLEPLLAGTSLQIVRREPAALAGTYEIVLLEKRTASG